MFAGHYAPAFVAAGASRRIPLWLLLLAAQFVDVLWGLAILAGIERAHLDASLPSNPLALDYMPWTHSLAGTLAWSGLAFVAARRLLGLPARDAGLVAAVVTSHWFLDLVVHRPDLTLAGGEHRLGLALWDQPVTAWLLEVVLVAASVAFAASSRAATASSRRAWWRLGAGLVLLQTATSFGPLPPALGPMIVTTLTIYAAVTAAGRAVDGAAAR